MAGWWDSLFGPSTSPPARPTSRGATFGAGYQGLPASSRIDDRRQNQTPYPFLMTHPPSPNDDFEDWETAQIAATHYPSSPLGGNLPTTSLSGSDPMLDAGLALSQGLSTAEDVAPYTPSFSQRRKARPAPAPPYLDPRMGPQLPQNMGRAGYNQDSNFSPVGGSLLPIGSHLPISPGDPGWTSPPSLSGPHNPQGDPARPGYGSPVLPMGVRGTTINSVPWWAQ